MVKAEILNSLMSCCEFVVEHRTHPGLQSSSNFLASHCIPRSHKTMEQCKYKSGMIPTTCRTKEQYLTHHQQRTLWVVSSRQHNDSNVTNALQCACRAMCCRELHWGLSFSTVKHLLTFKHMNNLTNYFKFVKSHLSM